MRIGDETRRQIALRFKVLAAHLNERQRRLVLATEARVLGHGGVRAVAQAVGVSESTVRAGVFELEGGQDALPVGRARRSGGGRRSRAEQDPGLVPALLALVEPDERGDPMSALRWTTKSLRHLAGELTRKGHPVSAPTVAKLLRREGFSLQAPAKTLEGEQHPDRDAQFRYLNAQVAEHQAAGEPVISVDAKKKEYLGQLPNQGREWRPHGEPVRVADHSFFAMSPASPHAIPYGVYDLATNAGWVNVGVDHDTAAFAVASIRRWWQSCGQADYPQATRLLITADAGGSNSYRFRLWKAELAELATETGLVITVCHFPPGTSKWNKIEHRLFAHITLNWRGRPLTSHDVVVNTIAATRTRNGLRVQAELDTNTYPLGIAVSAAHLHTLPIEPHRYHGEWNYTIHPSKHRPAVGQHPTPAGLDRHQTRTETLRLLADPALTGMTHQQLADLTTQLAPAQAARTEQRCYQQRGGPRRRNPGAGAHPLLNDADRVLLTLLYLRQICSQRVMAELLHINPTSIGHAIADTRQLLDEHSITITPTTLRLTTAAALHHYLTTGATATTDTSIDVTHRLADPSLTGMPRQHLAELIARLALDQAAHVEHRRHRRRGGHRQPGTRGGVFRQKLTDTDRVLATILYERNVATRQALADLFTVSPRTIGNALLDVRPVLHQHGYITHPAATRFSTAAALLASLPDPDNQPDTPRPPS